MMNSMRKLAGGVVAKVLMLFLIVSFAIWGISDVFRDASSNEAAKVGNESISLAEFSRQKESVERRAQAMGMNSMGSALDMMVLRQMVQQRIVGQVMKDMGLYANNALLAKALKEQPIFKTKEGGFDKNAFLSLIREQRISEADILRQVKDDVNSDFLMSSLDVSNVSYPASMRTLLATAALETRDVWLITIAPTSAPEKIDEAELKKFYEENKSVLYVNPSSRTLEYVLLKPQQIDAAIDQSITDDMISDAKKSQPKASSDEIKTQLRKQQHEQGMQILEAAIDDALASGANLSEALSKANLSAPIRTLPNVSDKDLKAANDDVTKTVLTQGFQMGDGETSGLIFSENGTPVIVHVKSLKIAGAQDYEAVSADVNKRVAEQIRRDAARTKVQEVKEALNKITGNDKKVEEKELKEALAPFGLNAKHIKDISRPYVGSTASNSEIPAPMHYAIFEHEPGGIAGPLTTNNGGQMLAIVSGLHHPDVATIAAQSKRASDKDRKREADILTQAVQARAYEQFTDRHPVRINNRLLAQSANQPAE